jgi:hypothetical protein
MQSRKIQPVVGSFIGDVAVFACLPYTTQSAPEERRFSQLTTIGQPAQAWIASEITNGSFVIKTSKSGVKVSWQVTGVPQDA